MVFRIGQKVVCIHQPSSVMYVEWTKRGARYPSQGSVYTIRSMVTFDDGSEGVLLEELPNDHLGYIPEPAFGAEHFRPVVERKTDISVFTEMLTNTRIPA